MRRIRLLTGGVLIVAFVVVPPLVALAWIRTWRWPTQDQVETWLAQPLTAGTLAVIGALLTASVWLLLTVTLVRQAIHHARPHLRRVRRLPMPTPSQMTAGSLAGMAAISAPTAVVAQADTPAASNRSATASPVTDLASEPSPAAPSSPTAGIELPGGGWIPYPTALVVTAIGALIWAHRRQQYTPGPPRLGQHHHDRDLQPLPEAAVVITAAVTADQPIPPKPDPHPAGLDDLPSGPITLHGPGAIAAARGLLTTVVLHAALQRTHPVRVSVTGQDLRRLLGREPATTHLPGLDISPDTPGRPADAVRLTIHRQAPSRHPSATDTQTAPDDDQVTEVTVGAAPSHTGWLVREDGTVCAGDGAPARLCVIAASHALDLLALVQHATRATPPPPPPVAASTSPTPRGRLTLLGGCHLRLDGAPIHLRRTASLQILAYLGTQPDGATTTDLIRAVWPGHPPATITNRLHTTLGDLRGQLRHTLPEPVLRRDDRYLLNPDAISTDLQDLRHALTRAATALHQDDRDATFTEITDRYTGDLAAGVAWPWLHPLRDALRRDVIDAYLLLAENAALAQTSAILRAAVAIDPSNRALRQRARAAHRLTGESDGTTPLEPGDYHT